MLMMIVIAIVEQTEAPVKYAHYAAVGFIYSR